MNRFSNNFTSKLNYSLARKRFKMMATSESLWTSLPKALAIAPILAMLSIIFFDLESPSNENFNKKFVEIWENQTYSDVALELRGFPFGKDTADLFSRIPSLAFLEDEPFSGVQNIYNKRTNLLKTSTIFVDGLPVHQKVYESDRNEHSSLDFFYNPKKTKRVSTRYYESGILKSETIFSSPEHNGKRVSKSWAPNGSINFLMIFDSNYFTSKGMEIMQYDEEGTLVSHEQYKDGELVEIIK